MPVVVAVAAVSVVANAPATVLTASVTASSVSEEWVPRFLNLLGPRGLKVSFKTLWIFASACRLFDWRHDRWRGVNPTRGQPYDEKHCDECPNEYDQRKE